MSKESKVSQLDLAFCLLRAKRRKKSSRLGNIKVKFHGNVLKFGKQTYSYRKALTTLESALEDRKQYRKALSLRISNLPLIYEISKLPIAKCVDLLNRIKHHGKRKLGDWCCTLHKAIAKRMPYSIFNSLNLDRAIH